MKTLKDIKVGETVTVVKLHGEGPVKRTILDESGISVQPLRAEMEAASWDGRIAFFPDGLSVEFEPGALPGQTEATGLFVDHTSAVKDLIQDWAAPESRD